MEEAFRGGKTESQFTATNNRTQEILSKVNAKLADPTLSPEQRNLQQDVKNRLRNVQGDTYAEQGVTRREGLEKLDPVKNAAAYTSAFLDVATAPAGVGKGTLLQKAVSSAAPAAASGALSPVIEKGKKVSFKDVAIGAGTGAAVGAAIPVVEAGIGKVVAKARPLNQVGAVGRNITPDPDVERKLATDYLDNLGHKVPVNTPVRPKRSLKFADASDSFALDKRVTAFGKDDILPSNTSYYHGTSPQNLQAILEKGSLEARVSKSDSLGERVVSLGGNHNTAHTQGGQIVFEFPRDKVKAYEANAAVAKGDNIPGFEFRASEDVPLSNASKAYIVLGKNENLDDSLSKVVQGKFGNTSLEEFSTYRKLAKSMQTKGIPVDVVREGSNEVVYSTPIQASVAKPRVSFKTSTTPQIKRVNEVLNPKAPDFLQVRRGEVAELPPTKYTAPELPINKPKVTAKNAPAGIGTIPLDRLGKDIIKEGEPRIVTGKVAKDDVVQEVLQGISKARGRAGVEGSVVASTLASDARKLGVKLDRGFIDRYQAGTLATDAEKQLGGRIKTVTDELFAKQQAIDPTIQYRQNYVPQSYQQGSDVVEEAAKQLQQRTGASNRRAFDTYNEAESFGLTPKYNTLDEMIGHSSQAAESALQNQEVIRKGMEGGIFTTEASGVPLVGMRSPDGAQLYAQKNVADTLNGILQENTQGLGGAVKKTAHAAGTMQDVMLQGGVPGTNANFFVAGQGIKDTTRNIGKAPLHPIQAAKQEGNLVGDFLRGKAKTQERFASGSFKAGGQTVKNADFVRQMADRGLYIQPQTSLTGSSKGKLARGWNTLGNNPTFGRYMPNRLLSTAQEVYSQSVKKLGPEKAADLAAETTKRFTGQVDAILKGRSNLAQDASAVVLFAPKYRESIINALGNVVKSTFPNNWRNAAYKPSRQLLAGMAVTLAGYEGLNQAINGHSMFENRQGQELSVQIPYGEKDEKGNQQVINIPFMPGFMTIPRAIVGAGSAVLKGDVKGVAAEASKALSAPLQTAGRVIANQDYFGRPIYNDDATAAKEGIESDNPLQAAKKIASYVAGQASPSWVRGALDATVGGKPIEQGIATALEAPIKFGKELNPQTAAYFDDREEIYSSLDKNSRAVWDAIHPKLKNVNGEYITDRTVDGGLARASNYLNNPAVLEAENEMARRAQARGEQVDPLFGELEGEQQRLALRIDTLPPRDPNKTVLKKQNPWYQEYSDKRSAFFDSLPPGDPNKPKAPIAYPEPNANVASLQDAYYQMKDSGMKRDLISNNPDLADQFAKEEQYTRAVRAAKNLPQYDKYPEPSQEVQGLMDFYTSLPKKEAGGKSRIRSAWIKSHPTEWNKMSEQFDKMAQFNLQQDAGLAAFEGVDLTEKGAKAIASLGGGGGGSGRSGGGSGGGGGKKFDPTADAFKYAVSLKAGGQAASPKVTTKAPKKAVARKGTKGGKKPKVSLKKSLV